MKLISITGSNAMTAKELKDHLKKYDEDMEVKLDVDHCYHEITKIYTYLEKNYVLLESEY